MAGTCIPNSFRHIKDFIYFQIQQGEGLLGVIIRFDTFYDAAEHMCHVLDVEINSPAELAGLQPMTDYLLGTVDVVFKNTDILFDVLRVNVDKPVEFYVYNSSTDEVRLCVLMPSQDWGGTFLKSIK